jgi:hypothetical protein
MDTWWSYGLSDFLMFTPATYWRLVELYNRALWPGPLLAAAWGMVAWAAAAHRSPGGDRCALVLAAVPWLWVAWAFYWERLAQIHLAAPVLAGAAAVQGALLAAMALAARGAPAQPGTTVLRFTGLGLALGAVLAYPWIGVLAGRPLAQAEVFGWMPDPTALGTLGLVFALASLAAWQRVLLGVLPVLFLLAGAVHHASMAQ